ncbi:NUDIX hydrolase [Halolamina sp. CBA1230]|uniref:NUDIX domain-containing protein n=1 Tax=Halolamina sp. CBA1230 TaxID=1853690 RepID=UPI001301FB76|nr:NUDIX domain-containing protein [Halolamina sp. CBA1230]QKY20692.1 NUDIX hydrolase [Halolamina sp. CBA1230]
MIAVDADYCPLCGAAVEHREVDGRERAYCPNCERVLWRTAVPSVAVAVVDVDESRRDSSASQTQSDDGDRVCCIRRGQPPAEGAWALPGGHPEHDEPLAEGAARELEEETGLHVDPDDLEPIGTGFAAGSERNHAAIHFGVNRAAATGATEAGDDADAVAFLTPDAYDERESLVHDRASVEEALRRF